MAARVGVILQARCGSTRLPGKALSTVGGASIVRRCLDRLLLTAVGRVILATTERPEDDALVLLARRIGIEVFRGSTNDVLARYLAVTLAHDFEYVIRATGDNPAVDIDASARLLRVLSERGLDYVCEEGLPNGAGVEAITAQALERAASLARRAEDREHVTTYIKQHPSMFRIQRVAAPAHLHRPDLRLTVDTIGDLRFMRRVFARLGPTEPVLADIISAADDCLRSDAA